MAPTPVTVTVTGAAGQIGYALLFRIASGQLLGADVPVRLRLLEIPPALKAAEGTAMELDDCAFPLLAASTSPTTPRAAFDGVNVALLVGARPRTAGMERGDLLEANGGIFKPQGEAINAGAADDVRVLVVGNPANTNALIAAVARAGRAGGAVHRDDPPRPQPRALPAGEEDRRRRSPRSSRMTIWGNHSATQYPDIFHAEVGGKHGAEVVDDQAWLENDFIPTVAKRGAAIIEARGASSAASAANAAIDHVTTGSTARPRATGRRRRSSPTAPTACPRGSISSFPVTSRGGDWEIVPGPGDRRLLPLAGSTPRSPSSSRSATPSRASA